MRLKHLLTGALLVLAPVVLFWGCSKGNSPVAPVSVSSVKIIVPLTDAHGKVFTSDQVNIFYYISGTSGAPVTGKAGTVTATTSIPFSFSVGLPSDSSTYNFVAVQINDATSNQDIAVGAATITSDTVPVTLGPVNEPVYQVSPLGAGQAFGFEADSMVPVGVATPVPTSTPGLDVICNPDSTGFELDDPALANNTIAYMGTGKFVDYLYLPSTFAESSYASKSQATAAPYSMAPGDVYCVKLSTGGYAWLQVISVSAAGPNFVYRVNTTLPYCGYERTAADLAASSALPPTPTATPITAAVTIAASSSITGFTPYDVAVYGPVNGAATTVFASNSANGYICVLNPASLSLGVSFTGTGVQSPVGMAVDPTGTYLYVADPAGQMVNQFSINGSYTWNGCIGNGLTVSGADNSTQASAGALAKPRYVSFDNSGDMFITDTGTAGFADVMEYIGPTIPILNNATQVDYWTGSLSTGSAVNGVGQIVNAGTTVVVANSANNRIDLYLASETSGFSGSPLVSFSSDNNPGGAVMFSNPQGVAYSAATGLLYISDTGNNRIVEMALSGTFSRVLSSGLGLSGPTGIKVDNATPPNVYVADTGNSRVLILN